MPWRPLAYGLRTGKYDRATVEAAPPRSGGLPNEPARGSKTEGGAGGMAPTRSAKPSSRIATGPSWTPLKGVASELGQPPATVALAWARSRPAVDRILIGVSRANQLQDTTVQSSSGCRRHTSPPSTRPPSPAFR